MVFLKWSEAVEGLVDKVDATFSEYYTSTRKGLYFLYQEQNHMPIFIYLLVLGG